MPYKKNVMRAMFDVQPVQDSGAVDAQKISKIDDNLNLRSLYPRQENIVVSEVSRIPQPNQVVSFEALLNGGINDPLSEIISAGGAVNTQNYQGLYRKQRGSLKIGQASLVKAETANGNNGQKFEKIISEISKPVERDKKDSFQEKTAKEAPKAGDERISHTSVEIEKLLEDFHKEKPADLKTEETVEAEETGKKSKTINLNGGDGQIEDRSREEKNDFSELPRAVPKKSLWSRFFMMLIGASLLTGLAVYGVSYGSGIKINVEKDGAAAIKSLGNAEENLKVFDFKAASLNFKEAYNFFTQAGESLDVAGSSLGAVIAELPGAEKLKSAKNLVEIGKLVATSGQAMTDAVDVLSKTATILDKNAKSGAKSDIFEELLDALNLSKINITKAAALAVQIDENIIPEDKREVFLGFKNNLPEIKTKVDETIEFVEFFEGLLGGSKQSRYLLLFQNNTELRPSGGFPGTYGVITFENGLMKDFSVEDIYNLDAKQPRNFVPPVPLQHITPTWGMRDAAWFVDFSVSAQKVAWFYKQATGEDVDGVITITPQIIAEIIDLIGPIPMNEYGLTINGENFIAELQAEIEYGPNRTQPKQIVKDLTPKLLEKIYSSEGENWLSIFQTILAGLDRKDILMYFNNLQLRNFAVEHGFSGNIKTVEDDYLMVNLANIKGSKTDRYTDTSYTVATTIGNDGYAHHNLSITRKHNGGNEKYGFYNRQNPAYVRVLVPTDSELVSISGNSEVNYKPLIKYDSSFSIDDDLLKLERGMVFDSKGQVATFKEAGKTGFAFWLVTDPGEETTVVLSYKTPLNSEDDYKLYIQKQPGITADVNLILRSEIPITGTTQNLNNVDKTFYLKKPLDQDLAVGLGFN